MREVWNGIHLVLVLGTFVANPLITYVQDFLFSSLGIKPRASCMLDKPLCYCAASVAPGYCSEFRLLLEDSKRQCLHDGSHIFCVHSGILLSSQFGSEL